MERRAIAEFSSSTGTVSIVTYRKGKRRAVKFYSTSKAVNYCRDNRIEARIKAVD